MKLYGISGLGADKRVFQYLNLNCEFIPIDWIETKENESIENYASRLSSIINTDEEFGVLGVSFGGLIAIEISQRLNPKLTILISSVEVNTELRWVYKFLGKTKVLELIPYQLFDPPRFMTHLLFGTSRKELLNQILDDTDLKFAKWAIIQLTYWKNNKQLKNKLLKINGTKDKLIPHNKKCKNTYLIRGGKHFMIIDRADKISDIINREIKQRL